MIEKNKKLGEKLLITGGGRCNVTNNKPEVRTMLAQYKSGGKFLFSAFSQFAVPETIQFFAERKLAFKEENEGRMFPQTEKAESVWRVLVEELKKSGVTVKSGGAVMGIEKRWDNL